MKKIFLTTALIASLLPLAQAADTATTLTDEKSRVSYALGMMMGQNFVKRQGLDADTLDLDVAVQAMKAIQSDGATKLTPEQAQEVLKQFQPVFAARQQAKQAELGGKNKAAGEKFLAANKTKPGVKTLDVTTREGKQSELQYLVLTNGSGAMPGAGDTVTVNYRGMFLDGNEFDSSYKRGQPSSFPVGGVIPGWTAALQKMPAGAKWKLFIPADLAYGEAGHQGIPPNSTLIFEVELLSIQGPPPPPAPAAPLTSDIIKVPSAEEMKKGAKIEVIKPEDAAKAQNSGK